ncbi:hypothetical protein E3N88_37216 [Mikania micrantha]|uniref:Uncharacterized protein n=1 Tax=Mikania micrantha TaxID=192012 RepID=A0A5N6M710_9ASTR|nr:hypothetical protein E3N88_37216 [Mikania micrantha]
MFSQVSQQCDRRLRSCKISRVVPLRSGREGRGVTRDLDGGGTGSGGTDVSNAGTVLTAGGTGVFEAAVGGSGVGGGGEIEVGGLKKGKHVPETTRDPGMLSLEHVGKNFRILWITEAYECGRHWRPRLHAVDSVEGDG